MRQALLKCGPPRHALAVALDLCQAHARRVNDVSLRTTQRMLGICQRQRDLDHELRKRLKLVLKNVSWYPEKAPWLLAACRQAFIVPVPGLLAELVIQPLAVDASDLG